MNKTLKKGAVALIPPHHARNILGSLQKHDRDIYQAKEDIHFVNMSSEICVLANPEDAKDFLNNKIVKKPQKDDLTDDKKEKVVAALQKLDPANNDHWNTDGSPVVNVVKNIYGSVITKAEIVAAAPEFKRPEKTENPDDNNDASGGAGSEDTGEATPDNPDEDSSEEGSGQTDLLPSDDETADQSYDDNKADNSEEEKSSKENAADDDQNGDVIQK